MGVRGNYALFLLFWFYFYKFFFQTILLQTSYNLSLIITLCGSTYAKFVCSIILKQPSNIILCSSFIEFKLQAHSILESNSSLILFFFFMTLIIPHHPFFFKIKATKNGLTNSTKQSFKNL